MKRFFDWLVRGLDQAGERAAIKRESECKQREHEAEKRGLREGYERQASALQAQIKNLKTTLAELEGKLMAKPTVLSPDAIAQKMRLEGLGYSEAQGYSCSIVITETLRQTIAQASETHAVSSRQILSGMVCLTWPDK